jgi:hypothetical protein
VIQTDNALKVRFSATVGEEPEVELALTDPETPVFFGSEGKFPPSFRQA